MQAIKAGVLEIADVFAVNKADREGADRTVRDLQGMLELRRPWPPARPTTTPRTGSSRAARRSLAAPDASWEPPIVRTVARARRGHRGARRGASTRTGRTSTRPAGAARARPRARGRRSWRCCASGSSRARSTRLEAEIGRLDEVAERIAAREADPYALADELAARLRA